MGHLLAGRVVVVTGAGRGIGAAVAAHAAAEGATVLVCDVDGPCAEETVARIDADGGRARVRVLDVTDYASVEAVLTQAVDEFGSVDGLVNNAGRFAMAAMEDSTLTMWQDMLATNVVGVAICGQLAARHMVAQGSGSIVNVTSGAQSGMSGMSVYGATKGAVASLTYTWAVELGPRGVRVNAVSPMAATRMIDVNRAYRASTPGMGELAPPPPAAANAPVVTFLLSDLARSVNGQVLRVTGGDLALMTHPAVIAPVLHREEWSPEQIALAFDQRLAAETFPAGLVGQPAPQLVEPDSPGWRVAADDLAPPTIYRDRD